MGVTGVIVVVLAAGTGFSTGLPADFSDFSFDFSTFDVFSDIAFSTDDVDITGFSTDEADETGLSELEVVDAGDIGIFLGDAVIEGDNLGFGGVGGGIKMFCCSLIIAGLAGGGNFSKSIFTGELSFFFGSGDEMSILVSSSRGDFSSFSGAVSSASFCAGDSISCVERGKK